MLHAQAHAFLKACMWMAIRQPRVMQHVEGVRQRQLFMSNTWTFAGGLGRVSCLSDDVTSSCRAYYNGSFGGESARINRRRIHLSRNSLFSFNLIARKFISLLKHLPWSKARERTKTKLLVSLLLVVCMYSNWIICLFINVPWRFCDLLLKGKNKLDPSETSISY